jgi:hypothetical protein
MSKAQPPFYHPIIEPNGKCNAGWTEFFEDVYTGDRGTTWTPTFNGLGTTGTPTITGKYFKITSGLVYFWVKIVPATNTSSTAGVTFIDNFPLNINNDGAVFAVSAGVGGSNGHALTGTTNIYPPGWTNLTTTVTIVGLIEAA